MPSNTISFTTGPTLLPDVGELSYNGCRFSPLFASKLSGTYVKDAAARTTRYMEYSLVVDGYVTLADGGGPFYRLGDASVTQTPGSISPTMAKLRDLLKEHGGAFTYTGRGFDLSVNAAGQAQFGNAARDVAWGPVPELLEFQPLGGGLSAKVVWTVTVRVVEYPNRRPSTIKKINTEGGGTLLQFNCETEVSYNEDYFSSLSIRGTMEIPLTREKVGARTLTSTVDDFRIELDARIFAGIDLSRFRVTRRSYNVSRDKRTMEFDVGVEEKPYMDMPPGCTIARGSFGVRPMKQGAGLVNWVCTLRATYIVAMGNPRRLAWHAFLAMIRLRMNQARNGFIPGLVDNNGQNPQSGTKNAAQMPMNTIQAGSAYEVGKAILKQQGGTTRPDNIFPIDFSFDEGLYLDSKTVSFSYTWTLKTVIDKILQASGLWTKLPETSNNGKNLWATTMQNISGSSSWLPNKLDPKMDLVVDFGGG